MRASRAYRPLASDRAAHSAPRTKRVDNTRTPSGAHTHMGSSPSTQVVSHSFISSESVRAPRAARSTTRDCSCTSLCCSRLSNAQWFTQSRSVILRPAFLCSCPSAPTTALVDVAALAPRCGFLSQGCGPLLKALRGPRGLERRLLSLSSHVLAKMCTSSVVGTL